MAADMQAPRKRRGPSLGLFISNTCRSTLFTTSFTSTATCSTQLTEVVATRWWVNSTPKRPRVWFLPSMSASSNDDNSDFETTAVPPSMDSDVSGSAGAGADENETAEQKTLGIGNAAQQQYMQMIRDIAEQERLYGNPNPDGLKMSHEVIELDVDGNGPRDRYVYVEEIDCIGCSHCATTATNTFFLENELGRARAFDQTGDDEETIEEAIDTCPVNCIYYVNWEDLVALELNRRDQFINNWARLVGGQDFLSSRKGVRKTTVMDSGIMRCEDCPGRGCATCPMYGVGENPEYIRKKKIREAKMAEREQKQRNERDRKRRAF